MTRRLTFQDVWSMVGEPSKRGALYTRQYEDSTVYAWEEEVCGRPGWSWAIAQGDVLVHFGGWTAGGRVDVDGDIHRAIEHLKQKIAQPRGAA